MVVYQTHNYGVGGLSQRQDPMPMVFVSQWNIGFRILVSLHCLDIDKAYGMYSPTLVIKVIFCALLGRTQIETVHLGFCICTPLVYRNHNWMNKCAHIGRTSPKNVRSAADMCASGAECTLIRAHPSNFFPVATKVTKALYLSPYSLGGSHKLLLFYNYDKFGTIYMHKERIGK